MSLPRKIELLQKKLSPQEPKKLSAYLIEGLLDLKNVVNESIWAKLAKKIPLNFDRDKLSKCDLSILLGYLQNIAEETLVEGGEESPTNEYEAQIQKFEADVRNHIRIEEQIKIMVEKTQDRVDEVQKEIKINRENYQKMVKDLTNEQEKLKVELERSESEFQKIKEENKKQDYALLSQEEELKSFKRTNDFPKKEYQEIDDKILSQYNHKRSISTYQNANNKQPLKNSDFELSREKLDERLNFMNLTKKTEVTSDSSKQSSILGKTREFIENKTNVNNFQIFKNSPVKKEKNCEPDLSKYLNKDRTTLGEVNRSQSVDNTTKYFRLLKEKKGDEENLPKQSYIPADTQKNSNLAATKSRDSSRLRGGVKI